MLITLLNDLVDNEVLDKAPRLKPLREVNTRTAFFTREQVDAMAALAQSRYPDTPLSTAILFGAYTGCRQGELLALRVGDVDLVRGTVVFRGTKNGSDHLLDIHPCLLPLLAPLVRDRDPQKPVFDLPGDDWLRSRFYAIRDQLGLSRELVWHSLRHSTGTWMAEQGIPIQTIASVLNHRSVQTSQRYVKTTDQARREAVLSIPEPTLRREEPPLLLQLSTPLHI
jgi:integrase